MDAPRDKLRDLHNAATALTKYYVLKELQKFRRESRGPTYISNLTWTQFSRFALELQTRFFRDFIAYHSGESKPFEIDRDMFEYRTDERGQLVVASPEKMSRMDEAVLVTAIDREPNSSGEFEVLDINGYPVIVEKLNGRENVMPPAVQTELLRIERAEDLMNLRNEYVRYYVATKRLGKEPKSLRDFAGVLYSRCILVLRNLGFEMLREFIPERSTDGRILREIDEIQQMDARTFFTVSRLQYFREHRRRRAQKNLRKKASPTRGDVTGKEARLCRRCGRAGHLAKSCDL